MTTSFIHTVHMHMHMHIQCASLIIERLYQLCWPCHTVAYTQKNGNPSLYMKSGTSMDNTRVTPNSEIAVNTF